LRGRSLLLAPELGVVLLDERAVYPHELLDRQHREELPGEVQGLDDGPVLVRPLPDEAVLELVGELEEEPVPLGEGLLPDDRHEAAEVVPLGIGRIALVRDLLVVLPRMGGADPQVHEPGEGGEDVDRWVDSLPVEFTGDDELTLGDVAREVGDGVGDIVAGHGKDGELGDGALDPVDEPCPLVDRCKVGVHVAGVSTPAGDLLAGRPDLPEGLAVVGHVRQDDENVHREFEGKVLRGGEGESRGDDPFHGRVVGEVEEDHGTLEGTRPLEICHEMVCLLLRDPHRGEDHGKGLLGPEHLGLAGDLEGDVVVGEACAREDRELLPADEGVHPVDGGDARLDELLGGVAGIGVDGSAGDVKALLGDDLRAAVDGLPAAREDPAEHPLPDGHLDRLPGEPDAAVPADPCRGLEDLDDDELVARVEDLPPFYGSVGEDDVHELAIADGLGLLDEDEGPGDLVDGLVLLHYPALIAENSASMDAMIFSRAGL